MKQVTEIPEWFEALPATALLKQVEVAKVFKVSASTIKLWRTAGNFPEPMKGFVKETKSMGKLLMQARTYFWSKKVILQEIQRRKEMQMQHQEIKEVFLVFEGAEAIPPVASFTSNSRALEFVETNKISPYDFTLVVCPLDSRVYYDWNEVNGTS
jgi:hypothetical protein